MDECSGREMETSDQEVPHESYFRPHRNPLSFVQAIALPISDRRNRVDGPPDQSDMPMNTAIFPQCHRIAPI